MRLRIASLMKLVVIVALDFGAIAYARRGPGHDDALSDFFGLLSIAFLFLVTPILIAVSWPFARQTDD